MNIVLGVPPKNVTGIDQRYILCILLLIARKIVTVNWRKAPLPRRIQLTETEVYIMEYMTAKL